MSLGIFFPYGKTKRDIGYSRAVAYSYICANEKKDPYSLGIPPLSSAWHPVSSVAYNCHRPGIEWAIVHCQEFGRLVRKEKCFRAAELNQC